MASTMWRWPRHCAGLLAALLLTACTGPASSAPAPRSQAAPAAAPSLEIPGPDRRVEGLLSRASASFAQGDQAAGVALLRAAASLGAGPLSDEQVRADLTFAPLPVVVTPSTTATERSNDGTMVAFIAQPPALRYDTDLATVCAASPLEWADLANGTRGSIALPPPAELAPLLTLDASLRAEERSIGVWRGQEGCERRVDLCSGDPAAADHDDLTVEGGHLSSVLVPRRDLCGRVESLSQRGGVAVVALPALQQGRLGSGLCGLRYRVALADHGVSHLCVGVRYAVIALRDGATLLEADPGTDALRVSEDERYAYVRTLAGASLRPLQPGLGSVVLAPDCAGSTAFVAEGAAFVAHCGQRIDVVTLGPTPVTRSIPIDQHGLGALRGETAYAVAADAELSRVALVFRPRLNPPAQHRFAILDAGGRVTYRFDAVGAEAPGATRATRVAPVLGPRTARFPVRRDGYYCTDVRDAFNGQTLWLDTGVSARFLGPDVLFAVRYPRTIPAEIWTSSQVPGARGERVPQDLVRALSLPGAGALLDYVPATPRDYARLVFGGGTHELWSGQLVAPRADHALGPTRWDAPDPAARAEPRWSAPTLDDFLTATGARSNLRVCPRDLRVVAVLPAPAPSSVWADTASCAQGPPAEASVSCGGGAI